MSVINLSRRTVLGGLTGGLVLGLALPKRGNGAPPPAGGMRVGGEVVGASSDINAWVRVAEDGTVTLRVGAAEMGQGVFTSLPMILAEELDVSWDKVRAESSPAHKAYRRHNTEYPGKTQLTGGSESVRGYWDILREAGATARAMLVGAAAARWDVDPSECTVVDGVVHHGDKTLGYGALAAEAAQIKPGNVEPKDPSEFKLIGTDVPRLDLPAKVDGSAQFGIDAAPPDALVATVRACPYLEGKLLSFDAAAALAMPGVTGVHAVGDAVAVVAQSFWQAKKALDAVQITWDEGPHTALDSAAISAKLHAALDGKTRRHLNDGSMGEVSLEAVYEVPYLEHAPIEPMNCTVHVQADRCDVWTGTQSQGRNQRAVAKVVGLPRDAVYLHNLFLGGGFGRRGMDDLCIQAAAIAMHHDKPVKLVWTREESFAHGYYRPAVVCRMRATLGDGFESWEITMAAQHILEGLLPGFLVNTRMATQVVHGGMVELPYAVPHQVHYARVDLPVRIGFWRSVQGSTNGFFRECFFDEVAHALGRDPIELRRELLAGSPRHLAVFERAVGEAGAVPEGQARGVAMFESFGSIVAEVADVSVTDGKLRVHRVTAAIDCGTAIHPENVRSQVEGAVTMGLSAALHEQVAFSGGKPVPTNYHQYRLLKISEAPVVDVHIVESGEELGGVGEPGLPPIAGAVCNAVFAATGTRIRTLPIGDQLAAG